MRRAVVRRCAIGCRTRIGWLPFTAQLRCLRARNGRRCWPDPAALAPCSGTWRGGKRGTVQGVHPVRRRAERGVVQQQVEPRQAAGWGRSRPRGGSDFIRGLGAGGHTHSACFTLYRLLPPTPLFVTEPTDHATAPHPAHARPCRRLRWLCRFGDQRAPGQPCRGSAGVAGHSGHRRTAGLGRRAAGAIAGAHAGTGDARGGQRQHQAGGAGTQPLLQRPVLPPAVPGSAAGTHQRIAGLGRHHRCQRRAGADQPPRHRQCRRRAGDAGRRAHGQGRVHRLGP